MTNQEILEKAIQKAIDGGWDIIDVKPFGTTNFKVVLGAIDMSPHWVRFLNNEGGDIVKDLESVIFNHDFAKSLWDEREMGLTETDWQETYDGDPTLYVEVLPMYKVHLQQMVIADDPIKYLGEHLDD